MTVLLICNDEIERGRREQALRDAGHAVSACASGADALRWLRSRLGDEAPISCVVADLYMPDLDGFDVLRSDAIARSGAPVVVIDNGLAHLHDDMAATLRDFGAAAVLRAPVTAAALAEAASGARQRRAPIAARRP
ncbi:MAG: response regulator [Alphaproteobacteria bacterium]|nr:response regulator [Alphaproteobacteria bacterium]